MSELLNITEAAKRLGISLSLAARYARDKRLRTRLIGRRRFVTAAALRKFAAERTRAADRRRNGSGTTAGQCTPASAKLPSPNRQS